MAPPKARQQRSPTSGPAPVEPTVVRTAEPNEQGWEGTVARDLVVGKSLGDYKVVRRLGSGGMGIVYEGVHSKIGRRVAIKVLRPSLARDPKQVESLLEEARSANAVRHRGIIDIYDFGSLAGVGHYLVMEYLEGKSLEDALIAAKLALPDALRIAIEVADALGAAHDAHLVHRDLKPSNIFLVSEQGGGRYVKLLDFGIAKRVAPGREQTRVERVVGTPEYMSPEQAQGHAVGPPSDLYALGCILYELIAGKPPFTGEGMAVATSQVMDEPPPLREKAPKTPPDLATLVHSLLEKEPIARPSSAREVKTRLQRIIADVSPRSGTAAPLQPEVPTAPDPRPALKRAPDAGDRTDEHTGPGDRTDEQPRRPAFPAEDARTEEVARRGGRRDEERAGDRTDEPPRRGHGRDGEGERSETGHKRSGHRGDDPYIAMGMERALNTGERRAVLAKIPQPKKSPIWVPLALVGVVVLAGLIAIASSYSSRPRGTAIDVTPNAPGTSTKTNGTVGKSGSQAETPVKLEPESSSGSASTGSHRAQPGSDDDSRPDGDDDGKPVTSHSAGQVAQSSKPMPAGQGMLEVEAKDAFVEIRVDGKVKGQTPWEKSVALKPGKHRVELRPLPSDVGSFKPFVTTVTIKNAVRTSLRVERVGDRLKSLSGD